MKIIIISERCFKEIMQDEFEPIKYSQWNGTSNEIVCGDGKVEGYEECDCGFTEKSCNGTNCYPAADLISDLDLKNGFPCRFIAATGSSTSSSLNPLTSSTNVARLLTILTVVYQ